MTTAHTHGPWQVSGNKIQCAYPAMYPVASINSHATSEGKANARLIAAAPELLAVLQAIAKTDFLPGAWNPEYERIAVAARAAIAKATS